MEKMKLQIGDEFRQEVLFSSNINGVKEAEWRSEGSGAPCKASASVVNDVLSMRVEESGECCLMMVGGVKVPVSFECSLSDGRKLGICLE